ncbi:hypothetical protein AADG42_06215 [Ammonicoccus fulvus]|uniref:Uncharacterized protein n=1 Tax=Ammonicoccus fulvus TaxID=3138240 RepID=A0ABZ3FLI9_9ACTN
MAMTVWKRLTVAMAIGVIVTLVLTTVQGALLFVRAAGADAGVDGSALAIRVTTYPAWLAVALVAVVGAAVLWAQAGRALTVIALVVATLSLLAQLGFWVYRASTVLQLVDGLGLVTEIVQLLAAIVLPIVSIVVLVRLLAAPRAATAPAALPAAEPEPAAGAPVWKPDQASGVHWQTAGAAASGAAAQNWGRPGERGGWAAGSAPTAGALPAGPSSRPGSGATDESALATPGTPQPVHQPRQPETFGPQALAQQYGSATPDSARPESARGEAPAITPEGRREPPRWTPLDRSSGQDPS